MPFLILGILVIVLALYFYHWGKKHHNHDMEEGALVMLVAGILLVILYGVFYRLLTILGS